jgi:hypothetical protein
MVYNIQDYRFFFWTLSIVLYSKKTQKKTFRNLDLFPSSGEGVGDTKSVGSVIKS